MSNVEESGEDAFTLTKGRVAKLFRLAYEVDSNVSTLEQRARIDVLLGLLDRARDRIAAEMEKLPESRVFTRAELRAFTASMIVESVLDEGQRIVEEKKPC